MDITTDGPTLVLSGDLDGRSTTRVRAALYDHLAEHPHVVADMSGVDSVDLTALRVALDQELSDFDASLEGVREVAFFPPMTGG